MKRYLYSNPIFKQQWHWFESPHDVPGVDAVVFFSYDDIEASGFKKKRGMTSIIDLREDLDVLWGKARKGFVRQQIEKGKRNGIRVARDDNFKTFKKIYTVFRKNKGIPKDRFSVFKKNGVLFSAYWGGYMVAGGIFISDGVYCRAWALASKRYDGADGRMREIVGQANRLVLWEAITYAKNTNHSFFDLGGINPDSPRQDEKSLAEFKEAFGGKRKEVFYYRKTYSLLLRLYLFLRKYIRA